MRSRTRKTGSKGVRLRILLIIGSVLLLFAGAAAVIMIRLSPQQHFRQANIPVVAAPETDAASPENSAGKGDGASGAAQNGDKGSSASEKGGSNGNRSEQSSLSSSGQSETEFNILLLGIDARESEDSRTDVMMLAHVNLDRDEVNLVSIPRDTRVNIKGVGYTKINHAHLVGELKGGSHEGTLASLQAVSNLCGCSINYYMKTNFEGFVHLIDSIGGLDVKLDDPVKLTYAHITLPEGNQHLSGDLTLKLVQERHSLESGDINRQQNQALVLKALIRKMLQPDNLVRIPGLLAKVKEDVLDTNLSDSDMISLSLLAKNLKSEDIQYEQIPGHSGRAKDPLVGKELYYWIPDQKAWGQLAKKLLAD